jgi:hypothetical protein
MFFGGARYGRNAWLALVLGEVPASILSGAR